MARLVSQIGPVSVIVFISVVSLARLGVATIGVGAAGVSANGCLPIEARRFGTFPVIINGLRPLLGRGGVLRGSVSRVRPQVYPVRDAVLV